MNANTYFNFLCYLLTCDSMMEHISKNLYELHISIKNSSNDSTEVHNSKTMSIHFCPLALIEKLCTNHDGPKL